MLTLEKTLAFKVAEDPSLPPRHARFIATAGVVDREGDVMVAEGMDSSEYDKNPIVLWLHDSSMPAVAYTTKMNRSPGSIEITARFPERPSDHPADAEWRSDEFWSLVKSGLIRAVSVRGAAKTGGYRKANSGDIAKYGPDVQRVISRWMLQEISLVPLPMNQDAVLLAVGKGLITKGVAEKYFKVEVPEVPTPIVVRRSVEPIRISVPQFGALEVAEAVRVEVLKRRGVIYAD